MVALDRGTSPYVTMATFAKALSLYLRGSLDERIVYAFTVSITFFKKILVSLLVKDKKKCKPHNNKIKE